MRSRDPTARPRSGPRAGRPLRDPSSRATGPPATRLVVAALAGTTVALAIALAYRPSGIAKVVVLDVGQGDGILVEGGRGGRMVIDGGPDPGRLLVALDERLPPWDRRIDILVLTHPHEDHVAGLALLLQRYRVDRVYEPGMLGPGPGYRAWAEALAAGRTARGRLSTGDRLALDAIRFRVLWPDSGRVPDEPADTGTAINNVSIVLLGEVGPHRFLLAGDIEDGVDPELVERGLPQVDLLKVAHHGSRTATTDAFLGAVRPRVAVVSAGAGNPYGHPAPATLERLEERGARTYRTDVDGSVEVAFDGGAIKVRAGGARRTGDLPNPARRSGVATGSAPVADAVAASALVSGLAQRFLCGLRAGDREVPVSRKPPPLRESPLPARLVLGRLGNHGGLAGRGLPRLGKLPPPNRQGSGPGYHRPDGFSHQLGECVAAQDRTPRLLLGRRRLRARCRGGRVPHGPEPLSRGRARALATRDREIRARAPPRRDS
jgi:competence protein ComEC